MVLFRDFFTASTAASAMIVGVAFVVMVMPAFAAMILGMAFMPAATAVLMFVGVTFMVVVMPAATAVFMFVRMAFVVMVVPASASVLMFVGVAFVVMIMPAATALGFFVFLVVGMLFAVMDSFLCLMAVAASAMMYMLFIVLFHSMSPYLEWKSCFLSGIILWCYFSIFQMQRKWSMRNTLIFQVGRGR